MRRGWRVMLGLVCVQACTQADDTGPMAAGQSGAGAGGAAASGVSAGAGGGGAGASGVSGGGTGGGGGTMMSSAGAGSGGTAIDAAVRDGGIDAGQAGDAAVVSCAPRAIAGTPEVHFHHVHFNTADPEADLMFFERFFNAAPVTFCSDADGNPLTRATRTERGWFLYTQVDEPPDPRLNTYMEHVGWVHQMPVEELARMVGLGVTLYPEGRAQCPEAAMGTAPCVIAFIPYYYYVQAPSGARVEVALGPGPATMGFGHVHFIMGEDLTFFATVSDGAYADTAIDDVNHIDASLEETILDGETIVDTRGKPIDHIAYSTTELEAAKMRIEAAGIAIAEDISWKPEYGFRSFFVRTAKGTWLEMVEDSRFQ